MRTNDMYITSRMMSSICSAFPLDILGIHCLSHWARVNMFGLKLAEETGADPLVVQLFSVFHDSQRRNNGIDPKHGLRGAALARNIYAQYIDITSEQIAMLCSACEYHTDGEAGADEDITVLTCWDADRLDLLRVGIVPDPDQLCTEPSRDRKMIEWACSLSEQNYKTKKYYIWKYLAYKV